MSYSQSRTDKECISFIDKSKKLTKIIGWCQSSKTRKWVENKNVIYNDKCGSFWISHVDENVSWIQTSYFNYNGEKYYVFLHERKSGVYKYKNIEKDWMPRKVAYYFVISALDYKQLKEAVNLKTGEVKAIYGNTYYITLWSFKYEEEILATIINEFESAKKSDFTNECLIYSSQSVDGVDIVRFRLPEYCRDIDVAKKLDKEYFEVSTDSFLEILID